MSASIPLLETPRLRLVPLSIEDAPAIQRHFAHWEIVKYLSDRVPWPYPADGASSFCAQAVQDIAAGKKWIWTVRHHTRPEEPIGVVNLQDDDQVAGNRGFWLAREWQAQGLMREASAAVTAFWFTTLGRPALRVVKAVENRASRSISVHGGMRHVGQSLHAFRAGLLLADEWVITREEWIAQHDRGEERPFWESVVGRPGYDGE